MTVGLRRRVPHPVFRRLRVFAVDPGMTARFETAVLNEMTLALPWEALQPGPVGDYLAVVDTDESATRVALPVDLDRPEILAQDGLSPSDGNPQFRQQMVYAVAMRTVRNFERALGRAVHWPPLIGGGYRQRLQLFPHYMRAANAHFDPNVGLCFGFFDTPSDSALPNTTVFTCLSQDVVAHELTHALLLGMNILFEGANPDVAALHEAFSDLVALLQHFWPSDVLRHQMASIRGQLDVRNALGAVAPQFGEAIGRRDGIRNALGSTGDDGQWHPRVPDPTAYANAKDMEVHERGDILVGAVFEALRKVYESRVVDLRRIATKGSGILPPGSVHPDLVNRFAAEASRSAQRVLELSIRALDYLPPVEATFGDFLRAVVTADYDATPNGDETYRLAFVDAFRRYGIVPSGVGTLSLETLLWPEPEPGSGCKLVSRFVADLSGRYTPWNLPRERSALWVLLAEMRLRLQKELAGYPGKFIGPIALGQPFEVQSFHPRQRGAGSGDLAFQWTIKLVQKTPRRRSRGERKVEQADAPPFAGVTLIVDGDTGRVRYQIAATSNSAAGQRVEKSSVAASVAALKPCVERRLRVFSFDPSLGTQVETAGINETVIRIPWERDQDGRDIVEPGPVGEYLEVVDRDPASACFYDPVDLNDPAILAQHGLPPSESNPQFHQQMVYAVAMRTIRSFETALGRLALWRPQPPGKTRTGQPTKEEYVQRLRIYPHALREANAYYSPDKKALLFGYFAAPLADGAPDSTRINVFTCLSHDIVAHEVTHALLDGMHRRFSEPSNPDVLAFHEAFADIVALFQHFSLPEILRHQIASTRGDLAGQNKLGELAQQFGYATGKRGALRSAIGRSDPATGEWHRLEPDPGDYRRNVEPHDRGAVLVAAVFDAFLTIYKGRVADLLRIASDGSGVLPEGHLHPDLANRLTEEAARAARHVLDMCIRALDYCPPVDITFGDYLRALVTADHEHDPVDEEHRRVAFIEAFRRRGIVPERVRAFSVDSLLWRPSSAAPDEDEEVIVSVVERWAADISSWSISKDRRQLFELMRARRAALHSHLRKQMSKDSVVLGGVDPALPFEVHSLRPSIRTDWEGKPSFLWVIELTQRTPQFIDADARRAPDAAPDYYFRGGCTLLVDAYTGRVRYSIRKRLDNERKEQQRRYFLDEGNRNLAATYFGRVGSEDREPFALLHRH